MHDENINIGKTVWTTTLITENILITENMREKIRESLEKELKKFSASLLITPTLTSEQSWLGTPNNKQKHKITTNCFESIFTF